MGRYNQAMVILKKNFKIHAQRIADNFEWLNEVQQESYWKLEQNFFLNLSNFAYRNHEKLPESKALLYNSLLFVKGKLLTAQISKENYFREIEVLRENIIYYRRILNKLESEGSTDKSRMDSLRQKVSILDKQLVKSWPEYANEKKQFSITWEDVKANLLNTEAAIEFDRFYSFKDSCWKYQALILKKNSDLPIMIQLCNESDISNLKPEFDFSSYYKLIWEPIQAVLTDIKTIYYSPEGFISNIPIHALYEIKQTNDNENHNIGGPKVPQYASRGTGEVILNKSTSSANLVFVMDQFEIHRLASTRILALKLKEDAKQLLRDNSILLLGGLDYDFLPLLKPKSANGVGLWSWVRSNRISKRSSTTSGRLPFLQGTDREVEGISKKCKKVAWQVDLLKAESGLEKNIWNFEGNNAKSIVHIATHGYAFPQYSEQDSSITKNSLRYAFRYSKNPMVRSGLILSGGNWAWTGSDTLKKLGMSEDGILTALEISQMNLKKTKLVVLSACETGLGAIDATEGVLGLVRAFKLAGVEDIVVSLWSVPDGRTREMMELFYEELIKGSLAVAGFKNAQTKMRKRYPDDPQSWAGFVLVR